MSDLPPGRGPPDDIDDLYRRASSLDTSRPSESVRRAVLEHAAGLATQTRRGPTGSRQPAGHRSWRRPAALGTLAAAALAGLLIVPRFLTAPVPLSTAPAPLPAPDLVAARAPPTARAPMPGPQPGNAAPAIPSSAAKLAAAQQPPVNPAGREVEPHDQIADGARSGASSEAGSDAGVAARSAAAPARARSAPDAGEALRRAAQAGDLARMQQLFGQRVEIDARDASGRTALMLATLHGQIGAVEALLAQGADPNAADADGTTPLQAAVTGNQTAIASALRGAGGRLRSLRRTD